PRGRIGGHVGRFPDSPVGRAGDYNGRVHWVHPNRRHCTGDRVRRQGTSAQTLNLTINEWLGPCQRPHGKTAAWRKKRPALQKREWKAAKYKPWPPKAGNSPRTADQPL